jgi:hypothetical protein
MSSPTIISGKDGKVTYTVGNTNATLAITSWDMTIMGGLIDVSNTTDGRRRITGLPDAEGSFELHVDTAGTMEATIAPGTTASLDLYTDSTHKFSAIPALIDNIKYKNEVEGTYDATVAWKLRIGTPVNAPT